MPHSSHDLEIRISLDGESLPLEKSTTIGRQLDNDLIIAGEDVLDFHLRLEPTDRGARAIPLGEASVTLNGTDWTEPVGLVPGDRLSVGQCEIRIDATLNGAPQASEWWLYADREESIYKIADALNVGRGDDNEVLLLDDHISRRHARIELLDGVVWLKDLGSANGTYVNGEPLVGGCRLFHGDEIRFDALGFQLVGKGEDLTPVRRHESITDIALIREPPRTTADTTEFSLVDPDAEPAPSVPTSSETGAFLLGLSDPVAGLTFRTRIGTTTIGRDEQCDVVISHPTVSARHAEIVVRPETTTITNLMATNGTRINGRAIQNAEIADGDVVRIGQVSLVFKDVPAADSGPGWLRSLGWYLLGASLLAALLLLWILS